MPHAPMHMPLIATIVAGLSIAFLFGLVAQRLRVSPLVGYLLAGVIVGPFTPGYVADQEIATELAEIGVILLMFGVGLHFSLKDLLAVRRISIPGAVTQMAAATLLGMGLGYLLGWSPASGFVFGLALSVASTVVLLRALQERRILQTDRGRIAVGWLLVEDLAMVLALVLLPALAGAIAPDAPGGSVVDTWLLPLGITVAKVAGFIALMLIVGRRLIPWVLHYVAHTGSRELFRLAVLVISLGVAFGAAALFGVSFALGAFFAGMILAESELSHRAAEETLPLRDAFAVLFFVSVGMLFNPRVVVEEPWPLLATLGIILVGKSLAALAIVRLFGHSSATALTIAASLAQIGEFSFILAGLGVGLGLLPEQGRDLILGGAIISILLNPLVFGAAAAIYRKRHPPPAAPEPAPAEELAITDHTEHTVVIGYGRVGRIVADGLDVEQEPFVVIETDDAKVARARAAKLEAIAGNAADGRVLAAARVAEARRLIVAVPNGFEGGQIVEQARRANPDIQIVARAHSDEEAEHLARLGADVVVLGEQEIGQALLARAFSRAPPQPDETTGSQTAPARTTKPAAAARPPILGDAEWALMSGLKDRDAGVPVGRAELKAHARLLGAYDERRLERAIASLIAGGLLQPAGKDHVLPTAAGVAAAAAAPAY